MFNTFNMGVGMSVVVAAEDAEKALNILRDSRRRCLRHRRDSQVRRKGGNMLKARIAVLVSGGGTNLQALDKRPKRRESSKAAKSQLVVASNDKAYALQRAAAAGIETAVASKKELGSQSRFEESALRPDVGK